MVASNILGLKLKHSLCTEVAASQESAQFLCGLVCEIVSIGDTGKTQNADYEIHNTVKGQLLRRRQRAGIDVTLDHLFSAPTSTSALSSSASIQLSRKIKKFSKYIREPPEGREYLLFGQLRRRRLPHLV